MAVQSTIYVTDGSTRTFPSTKPIATKQHVAVYAKRVLDLVWELIEPEKFNLVNNSVVFIAAPATNIYSQIEVRVADDYNELDSPPNDISAVSQYLSEIAIVANNIDSILSATNGEYITYGLPSGANVGDLSVDTLTGNIYQWDGSQWVVIGISGINNLTAPLGVSVVSGLPNIGANGEIIFNESDGYLYGYINGTWTQMISSPTVNDQVGIEVVPTDPIVDNYEGRVIFNTIDNQLKKYVGGVWIQVVEPITAAATVADGSLTTAAFAATIRPLEIVDTLPTTGNAIGRLVYLTTDGLVYRYTASGFIASIPTTQLTGTITSTQIGANQITTGALAVGAITADTIAANAITTDKIASNTITTGMIQAGAIGASQIATDAITATKIAAGAVTANKIAALSIDATKIVAGTIGADQIAANAITAGKISVGAVSASNIVSGTITSTQIAAGAITATNIASYAITAAKLDVNALSTSKFYCSDSNPAYSTYRNYTTTAASSIAVGGICTNTAGGSVGVHGSAIGTNNAGVLGTNNSSSGVGVRGYAPSGTGVFGVGNYAVVADNAGTYGFWTAGQCWFEGAAYPFTGSHIGITNEEFEIGDIIIAKDSRLFSINQSVPTLACSDTFHDKRVFGVCNSTNADILEYAKMSGTFGEYIYDSKDEPIGRKVKDEYKDLIGYYISNGYKLGHVNSIGEGGINVCSEGGNIEIGDYICTSSIKGKGMRQSDDLLHNYTVAKALEAVDWSKEQSTTKMISCTYHCG